MKGINLTKLQVKYLPAISWLVKDGNRGQGRTFLLAVAFIQEAIETGGIVRVFDHYPDPVSVRQNLMPLIKNIISMDKKLLKRTEFYNDSFRIN